MPREGFSGGFNKEIATKPGGEPVRSPINHG